MILLYNIVKFEMTLLHQVLANADEEAIFFVIVDAVNIVLNEPKMNTTNVVPLHLVLDELASINTLCIGSK